MAIHMGLVVLLTAVHEQPAPAVTLTVSLPPALVNDLLVGEIEYVQAAGTVQVPFASQGVEFVPSQAVISFPWAPASAGLKVSAKFTVRLVPDPEADDAPASTVHWLFESVPGNPSVTGPNPAVPASFSSHTRLDDRSRYV